MNFKLFAVSILFTFACTVITLYHCDWTYQRKDSMQEPKYIDLPEGISQSYPGDTLVMYQKGGTKYLYFYHRENPLPSNAELLIVK